MAAHDYEDDKNYEEEEEGDKIEDAVVRAAVG